MAENRVTAEVLEAGIVRTLAPGDARLTAEVLEVAILRVDPGGLARVTAEVIEVAIWRGTASTRLRSRALLLGV